MKEIQENNVRILAEKDLKEILGSKNKIHGNHRIRGNHKSNGIPDNLK